MKYTVNEGLKLPYADAPDGSGYAKAGDVIEGDFKAWRKRSWITPVEGEVEEDAFDHRAFYSVKSRRAILKLIESGSLRPDQLEDIRGLELARKRPRKSILESITAQFRGE